MKTSQNHAEVHRHTRHQQLNGSFRSVERKTIRSVEHNNRLQQARCAQLLNADK